MKAVQIRTFGGPEGLELVDLPEPKPAKGQVVIETGAIGVGFQDVMVRRGDLAAYGFKAGHILGGEVAGRVVAVGEGVSTTLIGENVWAFTGMGGGYVERAIAPAAGLVPIPHGLSAIDAVTLGSSGVVATFGLRHARFTHGEAVLIRGAAGPIGLLAIQLALRGGASVVAVTTSSATRAARLREIGATHVLDREGRGDGGGDQAYDVIFDVVAGSGMSSFFSKLKPNGRIVAVGAVGGFPPADFAGGMFAAFQKSMSFATFSANTVPEAERLAAIADLFDAKGRGDLTTVTHTVLSLSEAAAAHRLVEAGHAFGRVVMSPSAV